MSSYVKGRVFENRIRDLLEQRGYYVIRASASKGVFDLLAVSPISYDELQKSNCLITYMKHILAIQCKANKNIPSQQRQELINVAQCYGFIPCLATKFNNKQILINLFDNRTWQL